MNRHLRYALLAPLLVTSVALPSSMAAHAASADRQPAVLGATGSPSCKLEVEPGTKPPEYNLLLTGFKPNQKVRIQGPAKFGGVTDSQGKFDEENVPRGNYTVLTGSKRHPKRIGCAKPPKPPVQKVPDITDVDARAVFPTVPTVDCSKPQEVRFKGVLTGTGTGSVKYEWDLPNGKVSKGAVDFTQPTKDTPEVSVIAPARPTPGAPNPKVTVKLAIPPQGTERGASSGDVTFTPACSPGT